MKTCFVCGKTLPLEEFYRHSKMADGHLGKCKECTKKHVRENYNAKKEYYSNYEKGRSRQSERIKQQKESLQKHRRSYPEKYKARMIVNNAIRDGKLTKKPCNFCGDIKSEAHHEDYSKPLEVIWVCLDCHRNKFHAF